MDRLESETMTRIDDEDIEEIKQRVNELFQYETTVTDDPEELEIVSMYDAISSRLTNYYTSKLNTGEGV